MEIKFRPLQPSTLARRTGQAKGNPDSGQSFSELVESVSGTENNSEGSANSGGEHHKTAWNPTPQEAPAAHEESAETLENGQSAQLPQKGKPGEESPGPRLDITA